MDKFKESKTTKLLLLDSLLQEKMAVLSTLLSKRLGTVVAQAKRSMGSMAVRQVPSRWGMDKFKDDLHFYFLLAAIPLSLFTAYINITVGEAKLVPIPEGYKPKEEEYYKNPISRIMVKYFKQFSLQQEYEMNLHGVWEGSHVYELRSYHLKPGTMVEWGNYWAKAIKLRDYQHTEAYMGLFSQIGELYNVKHVWCYESLEARQAAREVVWQATQEQWQEIVARTVPLTRSSGRRSWPGL